MAEIKMNLDGVTWRTHTVGSKRHGPNARPTPSSRRVKASGDSLDQCRSIGFFVAATSPNHLALLVAEFSRWLPFELKKDRNK